jgi:hypothetical protein
LTGSRLEGLRWDHAAAQRQGACFRAARFNDMRRTRDGSN